MYHHQYFYGDTITRQAASQGWKPPSGHETISYTPPDANPVFHDHGDIIIIIIIIIITFFIIVIIITIIIVIIIIIIIIIELTHSKIILKNIVEI